MFIICDKSDLIKDKVYMVSINKLNNSLMGRILFRLLFSVESRPKIYIMSVKVKTRDSRLRFLIK